MAPVKRDTKLRKTRKSPPRKEDFQVDYKDPAALRRFISDRGKIRARRVTGLTPAQQREVATAIKNAREMALLPYPSPATR